MEEEHAIENDGWLFLADCSIFVVTAICNTLLLIVWLKYGYYTQDIIPKTDESVGSKTPSSDNKLSDDDNTDIRIEREIISQTKKPRIPFKGRLYITLSIIFAALYCYHNVLYEVLRISNTLTPSIIRNHCSIPVLSITFHASNRLFLYLYFIWRINVSFNSTFLAMTPKRIKLLSISAIILFPISVGFIIIFLEIIGCSQSYVVIVGAFPFLLFDTIYAFLCLYLFVSRLRKLMKMNMDKNNASNSSKHHLFKLQYIANKFTILSIITILFSTFVSLFFLIMPLGSLSCIDDTLNVICLLLSVAQNDKYYIKICILCRKCCETNNVSTINNDNTSNMQMVIH